MAPPDSDPATPGADPPVPHVDLACATADSARGGPAGPRWPGSGGCFRSAGPLPRFAQVDPVVDVRLPPAPASARRQRHLRCALGGGPSPSWCGSPAMRVRRQRRRGGRSCGGASSVAPPGPEAGARAWCRSSPSAPQRAPGMLLRYGSGYRGSAILRCGVFWCGWVVPTVARASFGRMWVGMSSRHQGRSFSSPRVWRLPLSSTLVVWCLSGCAPIVLRWVSVEGGATCIRSAAGRRPCLCPICGCGGVCLGEVLGGAGESRRSFAG
jgi:hypothetical protein